MEKWKALLVDDEEDFISTLAERLNIRGIDTKTATSGEEALEIIAAESPQVVVVDVFMPGMDGLELLEHIKATQPSTHVILLTGRGSTKEGISGKQMGAFDYLMKPIQIEELIDTMRKAVESTAPGE